jgi:hypothetical protein
MKLQIEAGTHTINDIKELSGTNDILILSHEGEEEGFSTLRKIAGRMRSCSLSGTDDAILLLDLE